MATATSPVATRPPTQLPLRCQPQLGPSQGTSALPVQIEPSGANSGHIVAGQNASSLIQRL